MLFSLVIFHNMLHPYGQIYFALTNMYLHVNTSWYGKSPSHVIYVSINVSYAMTIGLFIHNFFLKQNSHSAPTFSIFFHLHILFLSITTKSYNKTTTRLLQNYNDAIYFSAHIYKVHSISPKNLICM